MRRRLTQLILPAQRRELVGVTSFPKEILGSREKAFETALPGAGAVVKPQRTNVAVTFLNANHAAEARDLAERTLAGAV